MFCRNTTRIFPFSILAVYDITSRQHSYNFVDGGSKPLQRCVRFVIIFIADLMDKLIEQHMQRLDPKEARDMTDLFLIEHKQKSYSFEVSKHLN